MEDHLILQMENISKSFPGVNALSNVNLAVRSGTIHTLMGENGAGKSTLMNILDGMYPPDHGEIIFQGQIVTVDSTLTALKLGISMIHQELSPIPYMSVAENIFLGREPLARFGMIDKRKMNADTKALLNRLEIDINPTTLMKELSVANTQMVEIAKAIAYDSSLIIMDEPTSAITEREVAHLFSMIRSLKEKGVSIIYITHKMGEVFQIADDITVLRDGKHIATVPASETTKDRLITMMVGRELTDLFPKEYAPIGEIVLSVRNLTRAGIVEDVSFDLRKGEILGMAGLMGAGRTAVNYEKRGFLDGRRIEQTLAQEKKRLDIKTPSMDQLIKLLSGGNQQKVLVSRWLLTSPDILILNEPTRGIDVGAKAEIHKLMSKLAQEGKAIIMISSELPEILGMSDRILVMHEGKVGGIFERKAATQKSIMEAATGQNSIQVKEQV